MLSTGPPHPGPKGRPRRPPTSGTYEAVKGIFDVYPREIVGKGRLSRIRVGWCLKMTVTMVTMETRRWRRICPSKQGQAEGRHDRLRHMCTDLFQEQEAGRLTRLVKEIFLVFNSMISLHISLELGIVRGVSMLLVLVFLGGVYCATDEKSAFRAQSPKLYNVRLTEYSN